MEFGIAIPTCAEGLVYPLPFADHHDILRIATEAEELGFNSIMANDHLTTQDYVRRMFSEPPRYYEPLLTLACCAAQTKHIRLMTGVIVLPMRDPVLLAKQVMTLDQLSEGRVTLGVGVGGYREEFEAVRPNLKHAHRAEIMAETLAALRLLFEERQASFDGDYVTFEDVEMFPKPSQEQLPIFSSGNADGTLQRAAEFCDGWMPAALPRERLASGIEKLRQYATSAGRDPDDLAVTPQFGICVGSTREEAEELFRRSQLYEHLVSLQKSTLRGISPDKYFSDNLIGTPDEIRRRIEALQEIGVVGLAGLVVVANTPTEMLDQMRVIAHEIIPAFA